MIYLTSKWIIRRPTRPLPSGKIKKTNALIIVVPCSLWINPCSICQLFIFWNLITIISIISYNYKIKNGFFRPYMMAGYNGCNVNFGASLFFIFQTMPQWKMGIIRSNPTLVSSILIALASCAVYFHVFILTSLSKSETTRELLRLKNELNLQKIQITYLIFLLISYHLQ